LEPESFAHEAAQQKGLADACLLAATGRVEGGGDNLRDAAPTLPFQAGGGGHAEFSQPANAQKSPLPAPDRGPHSMDVSDQTSATHSWQKGVWGTTASRSSEIGLPHFTQVPKVPLAMRLRAASIAFNSVSPT